MKVSLLKLYFVHNQTRSGELYKLNDEGGLVSQSQNYPVSTRQEQDIWPCILQMPFPTSQTEKRHRAAYWLEAITATPTLPYRRCWQQSGSMEKWTSGRAITLSYLLRSRK